MLRVGLNMREKSPKTQVNNSKDVEKNQLETLKNDSILH